METLYYKEFANLKSVSAAAHLLVESATALGWDRAAFSADCAIDMPRDSQGGFIGTSMGWPAECVTAWVEQGMANDCPVTKQCGRATDSFLWRCDPADAGWRTTKLLSAQRAVLAHLGRFADGATTVPVHRPGGKAGYVSWFSSDGSRLAELHGASYDATYLISHAFIRRIDAIAAASRHPNDACRKTVLSEREIECLTWAAYGKTVLEIGIIIKRSHETARFHLRNAMQKLKARNRTHAVAIACSRGLITVR